MKHLWDDRLSVEAQIQILRNAIQYLEVKYPNGRLAQEVRDRKRQQLQRLEALQA